ncbi:MAG: hypothetical protein Unbinned1693contig1002_5 [Prokaryotic dsDNA virus sp.]|jgi:hypothetical protein|nr:MAG: hypothetical protein Unbinned1693contig1002_5 [Prokaryotic dsDNA virus sp.]|tara:strand:+ start:11646 stop:12059 length:414 start_codon:yes stop_codon:yes gene_type:complete
MSKEHLIPFNAMTEAQQKKLASKGGKVKSLKKKLAAQIREAKKKGFTNREVDIMVKTMADADCSAYEILKYLREIQNDIHPSQRVALANAYMQQHKLVHGEKIKTENIHHVINWSEKLEGCEIEEEVQSEKSSKRDV